MNGLLVTLRRELLSHCYSPVSYLIAVLFYLWHGVQVSKFAVVFAQYQADQENFFGSTYGLPSTFVMVLLVPGLLTMRCFAEERRSGSIEMLMTAPVRDLGIVLGKWLAAVVFYLLLWLPTVLLLWVITWSPFLNADLSFGPVCAAYLGMVLLSTLLLAFGCFASSLTDNVLLAAIVAILFDFVLLGAPPMLRAEFGNPKTHPWLSVLIEKLDVNSNFQQWFARGLIDTSQLWFFLGGTLFFLFLTAQTFALRRVESRIRLKSIGSWLNLAVSAVLMLLVWVLLVWVGERPVLRRLIDLTPGHRASVDAVTEDLLRGFEGQGIKVEIHAFLTPVPNSAPDEFQTARLRIFARLQELTRTLLRQYDHLGGEAVQVFVYDRNSDPDLEREAHLKFGTTDPDVVVVSVQMPGKAARTRKLSLEGDFAVLDLPGLKPGNAPVPGSQVPILKDFRGEQALSSALKSLLVQGTPIVYVLTSDSRNLDWRGTTGAAYGVLNRQLTESGFDVRELNLTVTRGVVPSDASLVAVLEPSSEFADTEVRALHDYLKRGGRLFVNYAWHPVVDWNPDGDELGRRLGYQIGKQCVFHLAPDGSGGGTDGIRRVGKLDLNVSSAHPITQRLSLRQLAPQMDAAREIVQRTDAPPGLRREELLTTGPYGWLALQKPNGELDLMAPRVAGALRPFTVGLVAEVDGDKPAGEEKAPTGVAVIVSGVFCNNLGMGINADLALNIFNWLAERRVLLDIRGMGYKANWFTLDEGQKDRLWWLLVVGVPGGFFCLGLVVFWRRRRI